MRIGDDTDTVAVIAGSLLGARWGADAVAPLWRSILHGKPGMYGVPDYAGEERLTSEDEELLAELGWGWPAPPDQLNWQVVGFDEGCCRGWPACSADPPTRVFPRRR